MGPQYLLNTFRLACDHCCMRSRCLLRFSVSRLELRARHASSPSLFDILFCASCWIPAKQCMCEKLLTRECSRLHSQPCSFCQCETACGCQTHCDCILVCYHVVRCRSFIGPSVGKLLFMRLALRRAHALS